jgi:hypothetical protein
MIEIAGGCLVGFFVSLATKNEWQTPVAFGGGLAWSAVVSLFRKKVTAIIQATFFGEASGPRKSADNNEENGDKSCQSGC